MAIKQKFCHECGAKRRFIGPKTPNHIMHAILSVLSAGLWLIVWGALVLIHMNKSFECEACGVEE